MKANKKEKVKEVDSSGKRKKEENAENDKVSSPLNEKCWSVVDFESCIASGLTYDEAVQEMEKHAGENVSGLCIVTDEAARRIGKKQ